MKKQHIIILLIILGLITFLFVKLSSDGFKKIYCLSNNKCITVWKKSNGEVLIIPGKYESDQKPTISHIKTTNDQLLALYYSDKLPNQIIVRNEGNMRTRQKDYFIKNTLKSKWHFLEY